MGHTKKTLKLGYNKLGYNKLLVIRNIFFLFFQSQNHIYYIIQPCYKERVWLVPRMFALTKSDCIFFGVPHLATFILYIAFF
jgi:hypothetical protein